MSRIALPKSPDVVTDVTNFRGSIGKPWIPAQRSISEHPQAPILHDDI